jgi:hypothetical protein
MAGLSTTDRLRIEQSLESRQAIITLPEPGSGAGMRKSQCCVIRGLEEAG